ncbi:CopG family transcriptional regulator [Candidatus Aerophobetes bacterium]|uniref:CopG family transcriptional regulator n=1 Tax=Aerophobetes bacterium TaxID=2030807 RepID=A0A662D6X6_UNCAE|nr:MAG: CopG family transcriptional regulator [Candidatus Aerophobetes bacterium]
MMGKEEKKAVFLSADLYKKIEERVKVTEFNSVEEYVTFVLEEVLKDEGEEEKTFSKEEEEEVKKRLRALGYLD